MSYTSDMQRRIYDFIVLYIRSERIAPTIHEIAGAMKIKSTGHINYHLSMLEKKGFIYREPNKRRGIKLIGIPWQIPVMGNIAAGEPLEVFTEPGQFLDLGPSLEYENTYALIIKGNSMIEDEIYNGDYVIIKPQTTCEKGDIVVAVHLQGNGCATLKRFFQEVSGRVRLQPLNSKMDPIYIPEREWDQEWQVQGKVLGIFRKLSTLDQISPQAEMGRYNIPYPEGFQGIILGENTLLTQVNRSDEKLERNLAQTNAEFYNTLKLFSSTLLLFAIARANLEVSDRAYVRQVYFAQAGVSGSKPATFRAEPFDVTVHDPGAPLAFDILIHVSDNIELQDEWHKRIIYYPFSPATQLVRFMFKLVAVGQSSIAIDFYHSRRWLRTIST